MQLLAMAMARCVLPGSRIHVGYEQMETPAMAAKKQSARGPKQDRARVAGGQKHEVRYESKKTGTSRAAVKKAIKKVGNSRRKVDRELGGKA
jgi:hypothetical protein